MTAVIIIFIFLSSWKCTVSICRSFRGQTCCSGTFWNKTTSTCEKCPLGYHGINCSEICSFRSYGEDCQGLCNCTASLCDYRYGCKELNGVNDYDITYLENATAVGVMTTTSTLAEIEPSGINIPGLTNFILYLIITSVVMFLILCSCFVGIYFYKHCIRKATIAKQKGDSDPSTRRAGYSNLHVDLNTFQQSNHPNETDYLEAVNSYKAEYNEIEEHNLYQTSRF